MPVCQSHRAGRPISTSTASGPARLTTMCWRGVSRPDPLVTPPMPDQGDVGVDAEGAEGHGVAQFVQQHRHEGDGHEAHDVAGLGIRTLDS